MIKTPTPAQEKIINLTEGKHLVLAPPGSGKTDILALRIKQALERGENPESMLSVTFTNRAAREMLQRAKELTDKPPFIGTLHTFGYRYLIKNKIVPASTILLDEEDASQLLKDSREIYMEGLRRVEVNGAPDADTKNEHLIRVLKIVAEERHGIRSKYQYVDDEIFLRDIALVYIEQKEKLNAIDFDDILVKVLKSLRAGGSKAMCNYKWVQADEVQDLNSIQWEIIEALSAPGSNQVYFGDLDQSIFSFMGASSEALNKYTDSATKHYLQENFRSPRNFLNHFNLYASENLPSRNSGVLKFPETREESEPGDIDVLRCEGTLMDEIENLVAYDVENLSREYKKTALLARTNRDADLIGSRLTLYGFDHFKVSGFDLFNRKCIKDVMAFLRVWASPEDRVSWARLFKEFGRLDSLRVARDAINEVFEAGLNPLDWLLLDGEENLLDNFSRDISDGRCVVFDTETTGTDWKEDDIIQIAAIELNGGVKTGQAVELYFSTEKDLTASSAIHGITQEDLARKSTPKKQGLQAFVDFIGNARLVGHNVNFDLQMLFNNCRREGVEWNLPDDFVDTLKLARRLYPRLMNHKLGFLLEALDIEGKNSHNAVDDVLATVNLVGRLKNDADRSREQRLLVTEKHAKKIQRFGRDLSPMWRRINENLHVKTTVGKIISRFFETVEPLGYEVKDEERPFIAKCVKGLDRIEKNKGAQQESMGEIFESKVREIMSFSEADLIAEEDRIVVSTVHKSKGLQFDCVVIVGCVDGVYPHYYSKTPSQIEEDARLLYVAMTRAKKCLYFSMHDKFQTAGGRYYDRSPSRFLKFLRT